jgi:site-specific DNA-cytosine methylase
MGFPDTYAIPGHPTPERGAQPFEMNCRFYRQIGNAVVPPVVTAIAEPILYALSMGPRPGRSAPLVSP